MVLVSLQVEIWHRLLLIDGRAIGSNDTITVFPLALIDAFRLISDIFRFSLSCCSRRHVGDSCFECFPLELNLCYHFKSPTESEIYNERKWIRNYFCAHSTSGQGKNSKRINWIKELWGRDRANNRSHWAKYNMYHITYRGPSPGKKMLKIKTIFKDYKDFRWIERELIFFRKIPDYRFNFVFDLRVQRTVCFHPIVIHISSPAMVEHKIESFDRRQKQY